MVLAAITISIEAAMFINLDATLEVKGLVLGNLSSSRSPRCWRFDMEQPSMTELGPCALESPASACSSPLRTEELPFRQESALR